MSERLIIALGGMDDTSIDWLIWDEESHQTREQGQLPADQLGELAAVARRMPSYAVVPAERVYNAEVTLPNRSRAALESVPYQLEEQLCDDVEQLHFALGAANGETHPVAVVSQRLMARWCEQLLAASIMVKGLFADAQTLPAAEQGLRVFDLGERTLIRTSGLQAYAVPSAQQAQWLGLLAAEPDTISREPVARPLLELIAANLSASLAINLLQGAFKLRNPALERLRSWRLPAVLAGGVAVLSLASLALENYHLGQHKQALEQQITTLYRDAMPHSRRIVNPKRQLENHLAVLRQQAAAAPFLLTLEQLIPALKQQPAIEITALLYEQRSDSLQLDLKAPSAEQLQQLYRTLSEGGIQSHLGEFRNDAQGASGKLTLNGRNPQ